jgi:hypothetical protein
VSLTVEWVPIGKVFLNPASPRVNDPGVPHLVASIRRFGWQQPIVAKRSGEVIAGNTRLKAAQSLGLTEVPVVWFEGSELDATAYAIADNRTHEFATWDEDALSKILEHLRSEDSLEGIGYPPPSLRTRQVVSDRRSPPPPQPPRCPRAGAHPLISEPGVRELPRLCSKAHSSRRHQVSRAMRSPFVELRTQEPPCTSARSSSPLLSPPFPSSRCALSKMVAKTRGARPSRRHNMRS